MTTVLLDTHVLHWWSSTPEYLSEAAVDAISASDELAVASVTWFELAWLGAHDRIRLDVPVRSWLERIARNVRTVATTPEIAATAVTLPEPFPRDPADRVIYATAIEYGWSLVTKDERLRNHPYPRQVAIW